MTKKKVRKGKIVTFVEHDKNGNITYRGRFKGEDAKYTSPQEDARSRRPKEKRVLAPPHDGPALWPDGDWVHRRTVDTGEKGHH
jgi:hypothetical protein